ncbi:restriction endonuclease subunit S [Psychrobacter glacincola]|uniref:restriction endonuclease subunit S n=1 Tax=Psychrobacter TaxID=497 RepID=UPI003FD040DE
MRLLAKEDTPSDWISQKIGSYVLGHKGGAALRPNDFSDTGFPVIPKKAIQPTGELLIENPTYCTNEFASNNKRSIVDSSYTITTLRDLVPTGPTIGTVVNFSNEEKYILSQGVYGLRLNDDLDKKYLSYLSNTAFYRKVMQRIMVGSTQVHIRTPEYLDLEIQLPPLPEQQKIAKILSTWDKAISTTERLIDNSTQQKKALMQQLLTGKKRLLDESGKRFEGEWVKGLVSDLADTVMGYAFKSNDFVKEGIPLVRMGNLYQNQFQLDRSPIYLPNDFATEYKRFLLQSGDLVMSMTGTMGKRDYGFAVEIPENTQDCLLNQRVLKIEPRNSDAKGFVLNVLKSEIFLSKLYSLPGGTKQANLSATQIREISVLIPPLPEQQKIATVLINVDKEIELLEQQLADLQQEKKALMQVLLTGKKRVVVDGEVV